MRLLRFFITNYIVYLTYFGKGTAADKISLLDSELQFVDQ